MAKVILRPEAVVEIDEAERWYGALLPKLAIKFVDDLHEAIAEIEVYPRIGQEVQKGFRHHLLRRFPYLLIYRLDVAGSQEIVHLLAVHHAKRHPRHWQQRD